MLVGDRRSGKIVHVSGSENHKLSREEIVTSTKQIKDPQQRMMKWHTMTTVTNNDGVARATTTRKNSSSDRKIRSQMSKNRGP
ncbi:unnamed protein product [Sphenostylis stenocarpa]|uniref:Uncharacterized protein n=1 Tax=Sphenostylis stenocarpa TaxID=92480 RepID=A0AA86VPD1_9FABA|nr:unnamed protein product [Sphenostylis stenocarpa]